MHCIGIVVYLGDLPWQNCALVLRWWTLHDILHASAVNYPRSGTAHLFKARKSKQNLQETQLREHCLGERTPTVFQNNFWKYRLKCVFGFLFDLRSFRNLLQLVPMSRLLIKYGSVESDIVSLMISFPEIKWMVLLKKTSSKGCDSNLPSQFKSCLYLSKNQNIFLLKHCLVVFVSFGRNHSTWSCHSLKKQPPFWRNTFLEICVSFIKIPSVQSKISAPFNTHRLFPKGANFLRERFFLMM